MQQNTPRQSGRGGSNFPPQGGGGWRPPQQAPRINVPIPRIVFDKKIDAKLYSDIAEEAAKAVAGPRGRENPKNKPSQLRRFYDELISLQDKVGRKREHFDQYVPFIQMLKAKVAYARGREKIDDEFVALLNRVVDQASDCDKLKQARLFMEAFMAFYKVHGPKEG